MHWRDLHTQAKRDFKSSQILYDDEDFGNSLFLLQQCVEKEIKSFVLKFKLSSKSMLKLNHEPLKELFDDLIKDVQKQIENSNDPEAISNFNNMEKALEIINELFVKVEKDFKIMLWKESLGISLNKTESEKIQEMYDELFISLESPFKQLSAYSMEVFENKFKPYFQLMRKNQKTEIQNLIDELKFKIDLNTIPQAKIAKVTLKDFDPMMFFNKVEKLLYYLKRKDPRRPYYLNSEIIMLILLAWIFGFIKVILSVYVHESYGRYPDDIFDGIDKKSSLKWYEEKSLVIPNIRKNVEGIIRRINNIMLNPNFLP